MKESGTKPGESTIQVNNPYGGGPNTGITLPAYYRPTPSVANANTFFPGMEELGEDEMRISFIGSSPVPRNVEIDPKNYYPPDVYRKPDPIWPKNFKIDLKKMLGEKIVQKIKSVFGADE